MINENMISPNGEATTYQAASSENPSGFDPSATLDEAVTIASENVGMVIAGGIAIGLLAAALMPRSKKKKLAKRSQKISALVGELAATMKAQAADATSEGRDKLDDLSTTVAKQSKAAKKQASDMASDAADQLNDSGKAIARKLVNLIEKVRG